MRQEEQLEGLAAKMAYDQEISEKQALAQLERYVRALENLRRRYDGYAPQIPSDELSQLTTWVDRVFFFNGLPTVVYAKQGVGKSFFSSWLLLRSMWLHPSWDFFSNLPFFWVDDPSLEWLRPPHLYVPRSMSQLLKMIARSILAGRKPATLVDEMDTPLTAGRHRKKPFLSWLLFTFVERHVFARGPTLIYHEASDIPHYLRRRTLTNDIIRLEIQGGRRLIVSERNSLHELEIPGNTPIIPYATHGLIGFDIDVNMEALLTQLVSSDIRVVAQQILDNIDDCLLHRRTDGTSKTVRRKATGYLTHLPCPKFHGDEWCTKARQQKGPSFECGRCKQRSNVEPCSKEHYRDWSERNERYLA